MMTPYMTSPGRPMSAPMTGAYRSYQQPMLAGRVTSPGMQPQAAWNQAAGGYQQGLWGIGGPGRPGGGGRGGPGGGGGPQGPPPQQQFTYAHDPLLQNTIAAGSSTLMGGRARMLDDQKKLLLQFGSREMARKLLGEDPFVDTVSDDPFTSLSTLGLSRRQELDDTREGNEAWNANNLFFSSTRGQGLADIARERMMRDYASTNALQAALTGVGDRYTGLEQTVAGQTRTAEQEAYQRAIQMGLASFFNPGAPRGGGMPGAGAQATGVGGVGLNAARGRRVAEMGY